MCKEGHTLSGCCPNKTPDRIVSEGRKFKSVCYLRIRRFGADIKASTEASDLDVIFLRKVDLMTSAGLPRTLPRDQCVTRFKINQALVGIGVGSCCVEMGKFVPCKDSAFYCWKCWINPMFYYNPKMLTNKYPEMNLYTRGSNKEACMKNYTALLVN